MFLPKWFVVGLLILVTMLELVTTYSTFREQIPNGEMVPHPCNPNYIWEGVGHVASGGGGDRNPFGLDFENNEKKWDETLCRMDSDMDGKTNGEELGDPDCLWIRGQAPTRSAGLSHPGICDPIDSAICKGKERFVDCEKTDFKCDAIQEEGVFNFTVRIPETPVLAQETTYTCMTFDFPTDGDYHAIAFTPYIDNINVIHHMLVYGCDDPAAVQHEIGKPYDCFMQGERGCDNLIVAWAVGIDGACVHPNTGIRIGSSNKGFKVGYIELHWDNPVLAEGTTDSSGINFYLTPNRRRYDAGMLMYGQKLLQIPPAENRYSVSGTCSSECTTQIMNGSVNIVGVINHMHYLGSGAVSSLVQNGERVKYLGYDEVYSYDRPVIYNFEKEIVMNPGDELDVTCHFKSTSRTKTTFQGAGSSDEMCFTFIMYYPKENFSVRDCSAYGEITSCELKQPVVRGCDTAKVTDYTDPETLRRYMAVKDNCQVGYCTKECLPIVREIFNHPCFTGTIKNKFLQSLGLGYHYQQRELSNEEKAAYYDGLMYWARLTSCDSELALEKRCQTPSRDDGTISDSASMISLALPLLIACLCGLFLV